jgi:hypothetical protein
VISRWETGYKPPTDIAFDDLGTPGVPESSKVTTREPGSGNKAARSKSLRSSATISGSTRRGILPGLFSGSKVRACVQA